MNTPEREIAQRAQEKFEFYIISLVFTLLALSIQTSTFGKSAISDFSELLGWVCLLISGIAGLWRLEFTPFERIRLVQKDEFEEKILKLKELKLKGQTDLHILESNSTQKIDDRINEYESGIKVITPVIEKLRKHNSFKYYTHRIFFIFGLILLILSRGYDPALCLVKKIT